MDRNTVIGLLLMGVLFFAFLMIQQPKQREATERARKERAEDKARERQQELKDSLDAVRKIEEIKKHQEKSLSFHQWSFPGSR